MIKNRAVPSIFGNQGGDWKGKRRSEALAMFEAIEFGSMPSSGFQTLFRQAGHSVRVLDGKAERFVIRMDIVVEDDAYTIPFTLLRPLQSRLRKCPVNLFLYAYENNAAGYDMEPINIQDEFTRDYWPVRFLLEKGYAAAAFYVKDAESDNAKAFPSGLVRFFQKHKTTAACTGRCIAAWAFAARQIINYLYTCDWIDTTQITVAGHSRCGKAALWCGAVDERIACTFANNSGCSGASLARGTSGERIDQITSTFPHWFCSAYSAYAHREAELPFDQHILLGLIAPRRLYVTSASLDAWGDPEGEFLSCVYAGEAFQQYDLLGLETDEKPRPGVFLHAGHIGYHIREGNHDLTLFDWQAFITYVDQHRAK
jgi:hypothetical protein